MLRFLFSVLLSLPLAVAAVPLFDPAAGVQPFNVNKGDERRQSVVAENGPSGELMLHAMWDCAAADYLEFYFLRPIPMPEFKTGEVTMEAFIPESAPIQAVNFRLVDSQGETFQFALPTAGLPPGWNTVSLRVDKSVEPNRGIWGGDGNHTLDFPVQLKGFSVDYPSGSGVGTIGFGKVYLVR